MNKPPPTLGKDILLYDATLLPQEKFEGVINRAAELGVPILFRHFGSRFGMMGRNLLTSDIVSYLKYQEKCGKPAPTCQVQGKKNTRCNMDYTLLIKHFQMPRHLRNVCINMLDNPVDCDPTLVEAFNSPDFIGDNDLTQFGIKRPKEAHELRDGVKIPSLRRWLLVGSGVSGFHRDMMGLSTAVQIQRGEKYWFWVEKNDENVAILAKKGQYKAVSKFTKVYGVHLYPGDLFVMNPGLIHAVVTKEDSFAAGSHFLFPRTLGQSFYMAKEDFRNPTITNDERDAKTFYSELLKVYFNVVGAADRPERSHMGH